MRPARAASRRFLPGSPFNTLPVDPPVEQYAVRDRVTHDKYGLGWVVLVEDDEAVVVDFGSRKVRILSPFTRLTKLLRCGRGGRPRSDQTVTGDDAGTGRDVPPAYRHVVEFQKKLASSLVRVYAAIRYRTKTPDGGQLPGLPEECMLSGPIVTIFRWHSARESAFRLIKPVPDGCRRAGFLAWRRPHLESA
jgi:hypothetical protein